MLRAIPALLALNACAHAPETEHPLTPVPELVAWLDAQGSREVLIPLELTFGIHTIASARLLAEDGIAIEVSDSSMGISLADRAEHACPNAKTCNAWLEGRWRSPNHFDAFRFVRAIAPGERVTHASFARESARSGF